jgi:hypothetical protein
MIKKLITIIVIGFILSLCASCAKIETRIPVVANRGASDNTVSSDNSLNDSTTDSIPQPSDFSSEDNLENEENGIADPGTPEEIPGEIQDPNMSEEIPERPADTDSTTDNQGTPTPANVPSTPENGPAEVSQTVSKTSAASNKEWKDAVYEYVNHPAEYKTVNHPAEYKTVNHPAEYKTVNHPQETKQVWIVDKAPSIKQEAIYEYQTRVICNTCGKDITDNTDAHLKEHSLKGETIGWQVKVIEVQTGVKTVNLPEQGHYQTKVVSAWSEKVLVKEAWTEKVLVKAAWSEKVLVKEAWTEKKLVKAAGYY